MADITLKNLGDIPVVEPDDSTHLLAEQDGVYARVSKDKVGVTSWNDLQDRPFYDTATMEEWNGDASEKHCVFVQGDETNGMGFVRVSEKAYTQDELREAQVIALDSQGGEYSWEYMSVRHDGSTDIILNGSDSTADPIMLIAKEDTAATSMLPALLKGTYFAAGFENGAPVYYLTRLVRAGGEIKQLDPKFIPSSEKIAIYIEGLNGEWIFTCDKTAEEVYARVKADPINTEIIGVFKPNMSAGSFDYVEGVVSKPLSVTATENSLLLYFRPLSISGGASLAPADVMVGVMNGEFAVVLLS